MFESADEASNDLGRCRARRVMVTLLKRSVALLLSSSLLLATAPGVIAVQTDQPAPAAPTPIAQQAPVSHDVRHYPG